MTTAKKSVRTIAKNRKALHNYEVVETYEAGIVLQGTEVKSLRAGKLNISDAYGEFRNGELWLVSLHISAYSHGTYANHQPERARKLLLKRHELEKLERKVNESGLTLVPLSLYFSDHLVKVEIALCRGKKMHDKRHALKERDTKRETERIISDMKRERN